ncbi:Pickpocket protein 28 [Folsomia candida]|uniref:Pickpocket protein 28 n=1 Tax=Folsomia candida TaxID=158441 RepID=A0A226DSV5_FOLCA|nr:Pickpocket protein 28 [Folsomia candida]
MLIVPVSLFSKAAIYDIGLETVCEKCLSDCVSITYTAQLESQIPIDVEYQDQIIENMKLSNTTQISVVHVYMATKKVLGERRKLTYSATEAVGFVGGNAGIAGGWTMPALAKTFVRMMTFVIIPVVMWLIRWIWRKLVALVGFVMEWMGRPRRTQVVPFVE